jgi:hypothetical protein
LERGPLLGREIVYCSECGARILASEFDQGRAATVAGKDTCRDCMKVVSGQAEDAEALKEKTPPPSGRTPQRPMKRPPARSVTTRIPLASATPRPREASARIAQDPGKRTFLIIGALVLAVLVALILVVLLKGSAGR